MTGPVFGERDPDERGYFGPYGGRYVPETLVEPVEQLERAYKEARSNRAFCRELSGLLTRYVGRPTPITEASRLRQFVKHYDLIRKTMHGRSKNYQSARS